MIVPEFWAEGRVVDRVGGQQVTVRRFGWSDTSQQDAQRMADARAAEALERIARGELLPRREPKRAYNGAEGVPIREEVVSRHGETVITRNSYGALCLNTPNVLFADIDFDEGSWAVTLSQVVLWMAGLGLAIGMYRAGSWPAAIAIVVGTLAAAKLLGWLFAFLRRNPEERARQRIQRFLSRHPDWHVRLYRTPAGLRLLAVHQAFDPHDPIVAECFRRLQVDPIYVRMCLRQRCFRARVSPKPWRIGIEQHLRPRPGVWPVNPERLPERRRWIEAYERVAVAYASCKFLEALGSGRHCAEALAVQRLHDELCQADRALPIA
jgi:hypothetical protein